MKAVDHDTVTTVRKVCQQPNRKSHVLAQQTESSGDSSDEEDSINDFIVADDCCV